jgi:thymidylate kinase
MIIGLEGLSKSGKTTFINKFIEKYPDTIRFRGAGAVNVGIQDRWQEYNFWMHNIIEQLDKLNEHKLSIMWDRFMTDSVHSEDGLYASEILRAMKSHKKKVVIFIDVPEKVLSDRGSKEGDSLSSRRQKYLDKIKSFDHIIIETKESDNHYITDEHIEQVANFLKKNNHNTNFKDPY